MSSFLYNCKESLSKYRISIHTAVETNFPCCNILNLTSKVHHGTNDIWGYLENFETPGFLRSRIFWDPKYFEIQEFFEILEYFEISGHCQKVSTFSKESKVKIAKSVWIVKSVNTWKLQRVNHFFGILRDSAITSLPTPRLSGVSSLYISPLPDSQSSTLLSGRTTEETNTFCNLDKYILKLGQIIDWVPHCCQGGQLRREGFLHLVLW